MIAPTPLFIATGKFDPSDGPTWDDYVSWAKIPQLVELVSLDGILCSRLVGAIQDEDWKYNVHEDYRLDYFYDVDYLMQRVAGTVRRNILGVYRNPDRHIDAAPAPGGFVFMGYDLIEEQTQVSALCNCGGFPATFSNEELNQYGLLTEFGRAREVQRTLPEHNPGESHADCELYAIWRLVETMPCVGKPLDV